MQCLNNTTREEIAIEAAHIIASVAYGTEDALASLLRADALRAILFALSRLPHSDAHTLRAALTRALRALSAALADIVGPSQWGLRPDSSILRNDAAIALDVLFQVRMSQDISFPPAPAKIFTDVVLLVRQNPWTSFFPFCSIITAGYQ